MGIQDDLFDVEAAIEELNNPGLTEAFDRLTTFYGNLERVCGDHQRELLEIKGAFSVFKRLLK